MNEVNKNKQVLKTHVFGVVKQECARITKENKGVISYNDGKYIVSCIEAIFVRFLGYCPQSIDAANNVSLAFIAPTVLEKARILKRLLSTLTGIGGLVAILKGVALIAGWGLGIWGNILVWVGGVSVAGPAFVVSGAATIAIASYFHFKNDDAVNAEKFEKSLLKGLDIAIDEIWAESGSVITEKLLQAA